eukprot:3300664-Lingulodinium_polyedra.AAC.1
MTPGGGPAPAFDFCLRPSMRGHVGPQSHGTEDSAPAPATFFSIKQTNPGRVKLPLFAPRAGGGESM